MSAELAPGTKVRWMPGGDIFVLARRKDPTEHDHSTPWFPGWWIEDGGPGLADFVLDNPKGDWEVVDA